MKVNGDINIQNCHSLKTLGDLTECSKKLKIRNCQRLVSLGRLKKAETVQIFYCYSLTSIPNLSETEGIFITDCPKLKSIRPITGYVDSIGITENCMSLRPTEKTDSILDDIKNFLKRKFIVTTRLTVKRLKDGNISAECMLFTNDTRVTVIKKLKLKPDKPDIFPRFATSSDKVTQEKITLSEDEWNEVMKM